MHAAIVTPRVRQALWVHVAGGSGVQASRKRPPASKRLRDAVSDEEEEEEDDDEHAAQARACKGKKKIRSI